MLNVLFLCTGNSCRSIMAEGLMKAYGSGRFNAYSAGSFPAGKVHPLSIATLQRHGMESQGFSSKSWDSFAQDLHFDLVITVCDSAAGETCPLYPGNPAKTHWSTPDPAHVEGTDAEKEAAFDRVFTLLETRIKALVALPVEQFDGPALQNALRSIP